MKTNVTTKNVVKFLTIAMVAVINVFMASCQDDYDRDEMKTTSVERIAKPQNEVIPGLEFSFNYEVNHLGWRVETPWTLTEKVTSLRENGTSADWASHKDDRYAVIDALRNVSLRYTQEHTSASQTYTSLVTSSASRKEYKDSVRYSAMIEDGNIAYLDAVNNRLEVEVRDTLRKLPYIRTKNATVKAINTLAGTTKYQTRAAYVSDSICREVVWNVEKEIVGNGIAENKTFNVELRDTFKVLLLSEDEIESAKALNKNRVIIDATTERCSFDEVFTMKSGEQHTNTKNIILNRNIITIDEYLKTVTSFGYKWNNDNTLAKGNASKVRTENEWTVNGRTDKFSALITNNAEPVNTDYGFYHESAEYKDSYITVDFEFITPVMKENNSYVESVVSNDANYDQARLHNTIDTEYFGYNQTAKETVLLQKPAVTISREYWDEFKCVETIYNDSVVWTPLYVIEYTDGNRIETRFRFSDDRDLVVLTNWSSIEENESQSTGNVTVGEATTRSMSATSNGATCTWTRETRELSNTAKLAGSNQTNKWRSIEPNGVTVTYRGKSFTFNRNSIQTVNNATVSGGAEQNGYKVYSYSDVLEYHFGDNTKNVAAPGTIRVKVDEPVVEPTIDSEGFENATQVITDSLVKWNIDYVTKWSDGKIERVSFACNASRSLHQTTNWSSIEANSNQSTNSATGSVTSSLAQSKTVNGAVFSWTRETRTIKSVATLAGSSQNNGWEANDPVGCTVTYKGKSHSFAKESISMSNNATVNGGSESNGYKVFNYRDKLAYTYGNNTKYSNAPGTIRVKVEEPKDPTFFPESWGEILEAKQTVANNEAHTGFVYTWSLRFKNGYVLPVVIRSNSTQPEWHFEYVEKTSLTVYNGGTYESSSKKWINTTASDEASIMMWSRAGHTRANKDYNEAKSQNWDEGRLVNGHASVTTNRYTLTISNGYLSAKDTYTGKNMGTWSSYVD